MALNSLSFCLSVKISIFPLNLNENLAGQSILGCRLFPFIALNITCHSVMACRVSAEKSGDNLMGVSLFVNYCFFLVAFNISSLSLTFVCLITVCLTVFLPGFILPGTDCASLIQVTVSFPRLGKFQLLSLQIFSQVLSLSSSFWDPYSANVAAFKVVPEVSWTLFSFPFSLFCSEAACPALLLSPPFLFLPSCYSRLLLV